MEKRFRNKIIIIIIIIIIIFGIYPLISAPSLCYLSRVPDGVHFSPAFIFSRPHIVKHYDLTGSNDLETCNESW